jgi:DNA-directed RNA polymerase specialized sigma24 family protein
MSMSKLTDEDWEWIEKKYGSLLHHIAYRVGGDPITYDHDDSYQELVIAVLDTVRLKTL